jgi:hypothetical protein
VKESVGGVAYTPGERTEHELKKALQKTIEQECGHLLAQYGFYVKRVISAISNIDNSYKFVVEIYSDGLQKSLSVQQSISHMELYNMGFNGTMGALSGSSASMFAYLFRSIGHHLRSEIEKYTRDMPVSSNFTTTDTNMKHYKSMKHYDVPYFCNHETLQDKIISQYNDTPTKRKSKFEHIDALIAASKTRLTGSYTTPRFEFKYF